MIDMEGWPIVVGARVRVELPEVYYRDHTKSCPRNGACGCPKVIVARHGVVKAVTPNPTSGRPYVEVIEFETFNCLTPSPASVRVMRGTTDAQRRHEMLTASGSRAYKGRVK